MPSIVHQPIGAIYIHMKTNCNDTVKNTHKSRKRKGRQGSFSFLHPNVCFPDRPQINIISFTIEQTCISTRYDTPSAGLLIDVGILPNDIVRPGHDVEILSCRSSRGRSRRCAGLGLERLPLLGVVVAVLAVQLVDVAVAIVDELGRRSRDGAEGAEGLGVSAVSAVEFASIPNGIG